jgi:hypothetical protein
MLLFTPPVAANLITSAPCEICSRTARRQSSAPLHRFVALLAQHFGDVAVGIVRAVAVAAGDRDRASRGDDRRSGNRARENRVAQRRDAAHVGPEVAHCREACFERATCIADADEEVVLDIAIISAPAARASCRRR